MIYKFYEYNDLSINTRHITFGDLFFYSKDIIYYTEETTKVYFDRWFDAIELIAATEKVNTKKLNDWFKSNKFSSLDPKNWTEDENILFNLTWG